MTASAQALTPAKRALLASLRRGAADGAQQRRAVVMHEGVAGGPVVVLVHPVAGAVFCYAPLAAAFGPHVTVLAVPGECALGVDTARGIPGVAELVAEVVDEAVPGAGTARPLVMGGWSYGGLVAFDTARQLARPGVRVLLLDTVFPPEPEPVPPPEELFSAFATDVLSQTTPDRGSRTGEATADEAGLAALAAASGLTRDTIDAHWEMFRRNTETFLAHRPQPAAVDAWAVQARQSMKVDWQEWTSGKVTTVVVPGDHYSFLAAEETLALLSDVGATVGDRPPDDPTPGSPARPAGGRR